MSTLIDIFHTLFINQSWLGEPVVYNLSCAIQLQSRRHRTAHSQTTEDIDPVHWINEDPLMFTFICSASAPRGADCLFCISTETVYFFLTIKTSLMNSHLYILATSL